MRNVLGAAGLTLSVAGFLAFTKSIVTTGVEIKRLQQSFAGLTGNRALGAAEFQFVTDTANRLGVGLQDVGRQYRSLIAATRGTALAGEDTRALFVALANASRVYGLSTDQVGRALLAFQQIVSKGKVSQEELRQQLAEALPGAGQIAVRAFGVTTQAMDKMLEKGLDVTDFVRRFTAQLGKETPAAAALAGTGLTQLGNELVLLKANIANAGLVAFLDALAAKAASILEASRKAAEAAEAAAQRGAVRALGGVPLETMLPADQARLLAVTEQLTRAEERLQTIRAHPERFSALEINEIPRLERQVEALRTQQTEIAAVTKRRQADAQQVQADEAMFGEHHAHAQERDRARRQSAEARQKSETAARAALDALEGELRTLEQRTAVQVIGQTEARRGAIADTARGERQKLIEKQVEMAVQAIQRRPTTGAGAIPQDIQQRIIGYGQEIGRLEEVTVLEEKRDRQAPQGEQDRLHATEAVFKAGVRAREQQHKDLEHLQKLAAGYTRNTTLRDEELAQKLALRDAGREQQDPEIARLADIIIAYAALNEEAKKQLAIIKARTQAKIEEEEKDAALLQSIREQVDLLRARPEDRPEVRLGQVLSRIQDPERRAEGAAVIGEVPALKSAKAMQHIYEQMGRGIEQTFAQLWDTIFTSGELSAQQFGRSIAQSLQRMFAQLSLQLLNQLLNSLAGTTDKEGGWGAALAQVLVAAGSTLFRGGAGAQGGGGSGGDVGFGGASVPFARGGITPALQPLTHAGLRMRHLHGFQPMAQAFARGGITPALDSAALATAFARTSQTAQGVQLMPQAFARGGITPALDRDALATALARVSHTAPGFAPLALARGGIVDRPSFALIGEQPGRFEAVVPLPDNKSIPVTMTHKGDPAPAPPQNIMFELHISFKDAIDPRSLRRSDGDIVNVVARDITNDGITRRVITRHAR